LPETDKTFKLELVGTTLQTINLFSYQDYRLYLNNWFRQAKETRRGFSYRAFAKVAGFKTSNFLLLVTQGKRNLTEESLGKIMTGLKLNKQEQEFFRNLVYLNQAKSNEEKNRYLQSLVQSKKFSQLKPIEKRNYEYYSAWYHPAIRELVASKKFDGTPEWLAKQLKPAITTAQAAKSMALLSELGFIIKDENNRWQLVNTIVSTGPSLTSVVVHAYHKILLELSTQVMDQLSLADRDVSSLTLGITKMRIPELRKKIREFRQDILKMVAADTAPEEVVLLNIQFYPVTQCLDEAE
jgi:uncharacterized protein (TIGR02147 family)